MAATPAITAPAIMPMDAPDVCRHVSTQPQNASCIVLGIVIYQQLYIVTCFCTCCLWIIVSESVLFLFMQQGGGGGETGWEQAAPFGSLSTCCRIVVVEIEESAHTFLEALLCARAANAACALKLVRVRWQTLLILWYPSAQASQAAPSYPT